MTMIPPKSSARALLALLAAGALAGCANHREPPGGGSAPTMACAAERPDDIVRPDGFGCATQRNLAAMLADPDDLDRPREPGPPTGDAAISAIRRHSAGAVGGLPQEGTSASGSAGGPGQN